MNMHTPGPWFPVEYAGYFHLQDEKYYDTGVDLLNADNMDYEAAKANATLAAAAPEMLEVITQLLSENEEHPQVPGNWWSRQAPSTELLIKAKSVIAKATQL